MDQAQIDFAAALIERIDSGEKHIFLETVNTPSQAEAKVFRDSAGGGVFYACSVYGGLRMGISFEADTERYNGELAALTRSALAKSGSTSCSIWVRNENRRIIEFLKETFRIPPDRGPHYYASMEFIMCREAFHRQADCAALEIRPYEANRLDEYLSMLDASMSFATPPPKYLENKEHHARRFAELSRENSFETFWQDSSLIGLYWRDGSEIDTMAVAESQQRKGYGAQILTRAIEMAFRHTDKSFAYLYAVDWNDKAHNFYRKYGMEERGHSYLLRLINS